jgi:acyl dehydratase
MPIDVAKVGGAELTKTTYRWDEDRVILYHLGVGAGNPPTDPAELAYVYEANLKVLPTFATIPPFASLMSLGSLEGFDINWAMLLHAEQDLVVEGPIPTAGSVTNRAKVMGVYDRGKAAVVVLEVESSDDQGRVLFTNRASLHIRGEGGFGGEPPPAIGNEAPERAPDHVVESVTLPQQALLYRLSGDRNPLHADPGFAAMAGFERPILHGLCTFAIVCRAALDGPIFGGAVDRLARYQARFSGVLFPGETVVTRIWDEGEVVIANAVCKERDRPVISNAALWKRLPS